ncbi:MAG: YraN family protein [Roseiarcus sp.]
MKRDAESRRGAHRWGLRAEWIAQLWLMAKGYRPLARRYSVKGGEIDLIVARGSTIAFVEVKARASMDDAEIAIDARKIARIARAARHWTARHPWALRCNLRGDAVFLAPRRLPRHVASAYTLPIDLFERA